MTVEFKECASCAKKAGSPTLCESCLHNRRVVNELQEEIERLNRMLESAEQNRQLFTADFQAERQRTTTHRKQLEAAAHDAATLESRLRGMIGQIEASYHDGVVPSKG